MFSARMRSLQAAGKATCGITALNLETDTEPGESVPPRLHYSRE